MKNGAVIPLRSDWTMDNPCVQFFDLFLLAWEQTHLFHMEIQAKISSEKIISSA